MSPQLKSPMEDKSVQEMAELYSRPPEHNRFKLASAIVHIGDVYAGHFVSYRRSPSPHSTWLYASDSLVRHASTEEVMASTAYMLFYERQ